MTTVIKANQDMFNNGQCFTKDVEYTVNKHITTEASLMDLIVTNELNEPHLIGSWWRNFTIVESDK
jgi:hypothetical protein